VLSADFFFSWRRRLSSGRVGVATDDAKPSQVSKWVTATGKGKIRLARVLFNRD